MEDTIVAVTASGEELIVTNNNNNNNNCDNIVVVNEDSINGSVTVQLPDGSKAIVQNTTILKQQQNDDVDGVAIELDYGRIGYLYGDTLLHSINTTTTTQDNNTTTTIINENNKSGSNISDKHPCLFPNCHKIYSSINHLRTHQRNHTGQRPHVCEFCNRCFTTGYALKSHIRTHTGEKPYQCPDDQCDKSFKTSGDLKKHVRTHTGERPFKCPVCDKCFTTSNIRKVHMRVHTGEKPYVCEHEGCGRKFASATNFRNHCRIHTGEKPYVCSVEKCGRRFTEYSSLYKHHMVHYQQKRFSCCICGRYYRQLSTLNVHKRTVHNIVDNNNDNDILLMDDDEGVVGISKDDDDNEGVVGNETWCEIQDDSIQGANTMMVPGTSSDSTTLHIQHQKQQIIPSTIPVLNTELTISDDTTCIVPQGLIDATGDSVVMTDEHTAALTGLELDGAGNGSIFVFTDPSQLEALQLAVEDSEAAMEDTVEVIRLEDLASLASPSNARQEHKSKIIVIKEAKW